MKKKDAAMRWAPSDRWCNHRTNRSTKTGSEWEETERGKKKERERRKEEKKRVGDGKKEKRFPHVIEDAAMVSYRWVRCRVCASPRSCCELRGCQRWCVVLRFRSIAPTHLA